MKNFLKILFWVGVFVGAIFLAIDYESWVVFWSVIVVEVSLFFLIKLVGWWWEDPSGFQDACERANKNTEQQRIKKLQKKNARLHQTAHNLLTCPICGSNNIRIIDSVDRELYEKAFGDFNILENKTFECIGCGYTW